MEKPEIPKLKIMTPKNCESVLKLYQTFSITEIRQKEKEYIQKIEFLRTHDYSKEVIELNEDRLNLLFYEEELRTYIEYCENEHYNDDNNLDQFDTEYWFNDDD